jgi:hypothetical protein
MDKFPEQVHAKQDPGHTASGFPSHDPTTAGPPAAHPLAPGATPYGYIAPAPQSSQRSAGNCSMCGSSIEQGDAFCGSCGARRAEATMPPQREDGFSSPATPPSFSQPYTHERSPNHVAAQPQPKPQMPVRMSATGWILCGGAVGVAVAALLPWSQASASAFGVTVASVSSSPAGGGPVLLIALAAAALGFGWPSLRGELAQRRWLGLVVVAGVLSIFVVTNWSDLSQLQRNNPGVQVTAGAGLYLYTAGVVALWVSVAREAVRRRRAKFIAKPVTTR